MRTTFFQCLVFNALLFTSFFSRSQQLADRRLYRINTPTNQPNNRPNNVVKTNTSFIYIYIYQQQSDYSTNKQTNKQTNLLKGKVYDD